MTKILALSAKSLSLTSLGVGVISTVALAKLGRPLLVGAIRLGYEAKEGTQKMFDDARDMANDVREEARGSKKAAASKS